MRTHLALLLLATLTVAGCGTLSSTGKSTRSSADADRNDASGPEDDYSPRAVERRTEAHARYAVAVLHDWEDESDLAAEEYSKAGLADPGNEALVLEVSQRLLQLKQNDKALEVLSKATAEPGASGTLFAQLGRVFQLLGKKDSAIQAHRMAIKRSPRALPGYRHLAQLLVQNDQPGEALKVLDQASRQTEVDAAFLIELSELYNGFPRVASNVVAKPHALDALHRAARLNPTNPVLLQKLADGFSIFGATDEATVYYLKLLDKFPGLPGVREKLTEIYIQKQDRKKAAEQLEALLQDNPTNPQAYYVLGRIADEEKRFKEARDYFNKTLLLNPNFEEVYYYMAGAQISLNQPREALTTLEKARARFPQNFVCEYYAALAFTRMKEYSNSITHLIAAEVIARAGDTNRLNHVFYFQLGSAYERNQKYDEAEINFKKCIERSPDFTEALNYLGYMWAERGVNLPQARELIEKAVKLEPKNAAFLDSLGWVLFKLGQPREALGYVLKSIEHTEEPDATLLDHLGDIYWSLRQPDKARAAWRKSIDIEPNEQIQKKLGSESVSGTAPR